jgi:hypothetical protein
MIFKLGKYIIRDWDNSYHIWKRNIILDDACASQIGDICIAIEGHFDKNECIITSKFFIKVYGTDIFSVCEEYYKGKPFETTKEAKAYMDYYLNKIVNLKAFL